MAKYTLKFHELAREEISDAYIFYENQKPRLGIDFFETIEDTFELITESPESFPIEFKQIRKAVVKKFPYNILFIVQTQTIFILAVFHTKQNPSQWKKRAT